MGEGGSIPLINILQERYPEADFIITGVLGPGSNAHSVNESLNIDYLRKLMEVLTAVLRDFK